MAIRHCKQQLKRLWEGKHCGYGSGKVVDSKSSSSPDNSIAAATQTSKERNKQLVVIAVTAGTAAAEKRWRLWQLNETAMTGDNFF